MFDSMYSTVNVLSTDGLEYIVDFINRNLKDSVRGDLIPRKYFLMINMYGVVTKNMEFYLQPGTDNNFLKRLIDTIEISKYRNECTVLVSKLKEYDKANRNSR